MNDLIIAFGLALVLLSPLVGTLVGRFIAAASADHQAQRAEQLRYRDADRDGAGSHTADIA